MRIILLLCGLLATSPAALGQTLNTTFLSGFLAALNNAGLTQLATVAQQVSNTSIGEQLFQVLSSGDPMLVFGPNNEAFSGIPSVADTPDNLLADILTYHTVSGNFTAVFTKSPNDTLGRTFLDDQSVVQLEGNSSQVVAWSVGQNGQVQVLNQLTETSVLNTTAYENVLVWTIDNILDIPADLLATVSEPTFALTNIVGNLSSIPVPLFNTTNNETLFETLNSNLRGYTLFAPNDTAMNIAFTNNPSLSLNTSFTDLENILLNHLINGTTAYSPLLLEQNYTSSGGQSFSFSIDETGQYVTSGGVKARIIQPDMLVSNGVVHIIDTVLLNTNFDGNAASSALFSATASPTQVVTGLGPIGATTTPSAGSSPPLTKSNDALMNSPFSNPVVTMLGATMILMWVNYM